MSLELHSFEAERAVLGALLLSDRAMYAVAMEEGLSADDFYSPRHRAVYASMRRLFDRGEAMDRVTLTQELKEAGEFDAAGGAETLDAVGGPVTAAGNVRQYARIVRDNGKLRRLVTATHDIQQLVAERKGSPRELIERAELLVLDAGRDEKSKDFGVISDDVQEELQRLYDLSSGKRPPEGVKTRLAALDKLTGGFQKGNLVVIAGRPAMGKSVLASNFAEDACDVGLSVAMFSLEMSKSEVIQRMVSAKARVKTEDLRMGTVPPGRWDKIAQAAASIAESKLFIDDTTDISIREIQAKARRLHQRQPLDLVVVDYIQLIRASEQADNRTAAVGEMSRGLKVMAAELNCTVIALSQLSRKLEERGDKRPKLNDLRESGQIEQDADIVAMLYRDDYYDPDSEDVGLAELGIEKHRNGALGRIKMVFMGEYVRFGPYDAEAARQHGADANFATV